jgi:hypothetical protein
MSQAPGADEGGLKKPLEHLRSILIPGETLESWAVQSRFFALTHRRLLVGATTGRLIALTRGLLGGFDVEDIRWQDLEEVKLHVGIVAAKLTVHSARPSDLATQSGHGGGRVMSFEGLRKHQAEAVYRICQAQDQAWREKRRVRDLEELRARSGGIQTGVAATLGAATVAGVQSEAVRRLEDAKKMLDERLITDSEYEAIKAKILSS